MPISEPQEVSKLILEAAKDQGFPILEDYNGQEQEGFSIFQVDNNSCFVSNSNRNNDSRCYSNNLILSLDSEMLMVVNV